MAKRSKKKPRRRPLQPNSPRAPMFFHPQKAGLQQRSCLLLICCNQAMSIRILVIEDEPQIADFVVRGLREEGYSVEHQADGVAGWQAVRSGNWDLVLLD